MLSFPEDKIYLNKDIKELDRDTADMLFTELNVDELELEEENFWDMSEIKLEPASNLNSKELIHFDKLKNSASKMFANDIDELGACSIMEHKIRIKSDNQLPLYTPPYRKSKTERDFLISEIDKMLKTGIIRPSISPWSSDALTSYPVLRLADVNRPFLLYTDASGYAVGAILAQIDDDGKEYVVAYASRLMTKHEIN
ncbi:unnamed protein product [Brachionus calyciflorus]|uniref:Reverse transcriptase/retrotransposon-derived protein RNase H-like domain-containing protein n=1 Tax=Brachionus calyciflorus TaxID=104777 RepID=A0A814KT45_9BILA|nr:unnamed protein product [Brachionus calyciflorus]